MPSTTATSRDPYKYTLDGNTWVFLASAPGIARFMQEDPATGRVKFPDNWQEFAACVIHPDQAQALYDFVEAGKFGELYLHEAAQGAFKNSTGRAEVESAERVLLRYMAKANAAMKAAAQEAVAQQRATTEQAGQEEAPLEDSSATG